MSKHVAVLALASLALFACSSDSSNTAPKPLTFVATLSGANEIPVRNTQASGTATFTVSNGQITLTSLSVQNIDSVTASHIHLGPGTLASGPIIVPFQLAVTTPTGHIGASQTLVSNFAITQSSIVGVGGAPAITTDSLLALFNNGGAYVNVHTRAFPAGEMRGQVVKQP